MFKEKKEFNWGIYLETLSGWALAIGLISAVIILIVHIANNAALSESLRAPILLAIIVGLIYSFLTVLGTLFLHGILKGLSKILLMEYVIEPNNETQE